MLALGIYLSCVREYYILFSVGSVLLVLADIGNAKTSKVQNKWQKTGSALFLYVCAYIRGWMLVGVSYYLVVT